VGGGTGHPVGDIAHWNAIAARAAPPAVGWFPAALAAQGRPDLRRTWLLQWRDTFLSQALDRLN
jgi:hypothetical protein